MKYSVNQSGGLQHISTAERGAVCGCTCIGCGEPVIARKGDVREHHFSHASDGGVCSGYLESVLHKLAKDVLFEAGGMNVPDDTSVRPKTLWVDFDSVSLEVWQVGYRPDLIAKIGDVDLVIEIAVTSFIGEAKRDLLIQRGVSCLEIDLSPHYHEDFVDAAVRATLIQELSQKRWIIPMPRVGGVAAAIDPVVSVTLLETIRAGIDAAVSVAKPSEEKIKIFGTAVWFKRWPDGGLDVRTPYYNPAVAAACQQLRRGFGGRWIKEKGTSRFPAFSAEAVVAELRRLPGSWER